MKMTGRRAVHLTSIAAGDMIRDPWWNMIGDFRITDIAHPGQNIEVWIGGITFIFPSEGIYEARFPFRPSGAMVHETPIRVCEASVYDYVPQLLKPDSDSIAYMQTDIGYCPRIISMRLLRNPTSTVPNKKVEIQLTIPNQPGSHMKIVMDAADVLDLQTVLNRMSTQMITIEPDYESAGPYKHALTGATGMWLALHPYDRGRWPAHIPMYNANCGGEMRPPGRYRKWDPNLIPDLSPEQKFIPHPYDPRFKTNKRRLIVPSDGALFKEP